jgi:hypothetical protein
MRKGEELWYTGIGVNEFILAVYAKYGDNCNLGVVARDHSRLKKKYANKKIKKPKTTFKAEPTPIIIDTSVGKKHIETVKPASNQYLIQEYIKPVNSDPYSLNLDGITPDVKRNVIDYLAYLKRQNLVVTKELLVRYMPKDDVETLIKNNPDKIRVTKW